MFLVNAFRLCLRSPNYKYLCWHSSFRVVALLVKQLGRQAFQNEKGIHNKQKLFQWFLFKLWVVFFCLFCSLAALLFITEREIGSWINFRLFIHRNIWHQLDCFQFWEITSFLSHISQQSDKIPHQQYLLLGGYKFLQHNWSTDERWKYNFLKLVEDDFGKLKRMTI